MPTNETPSSDNDGTRTRMPGWLPGAAIGALGLCAVLGLAVLSSHRTPRTAPPRRQRPPPRPPRRQHPRPPRRRASIPCGWMPAATR